MFLTKHWQTVDCERQDVVFNFSLLNYPNFSKAPTQTPKLKALQKLIQSYFYNILHLIEGLSDENTLLLAVNESSKIVPYIISSRKAVKTYIKVCDNLPMKLYC